MSNSYKDWIDTCNNNLTPILAEFSKNNISLQNHIEIFNLLLYLPPKEITIRIFCNPDIKIINTSLKLLLENFNFIFGLKAKWLARKLKTNQAKIKFILITKCLIGCDYFYNKKYTSAFDSFRWCLKLLYYLEKQFKHHKEIKFDLDMLNDIELFCNIYCSRCLLKDYRENNIFEWMNLREDKKSALDDTVISESLLYGILRSFKDSSNTSNTIVLPEQYKTNKVLEILTELLYFIATSKSSLTEYEVEHTEKYFRLALKVNRTSLVSIIEKTIVILTTKLSNDPCVINTTVSLIKYIILYGGIQVSVLYFFYSLYLYYLKQFPHYQAMSQVQLEEDCIKFATLVYTKVNDDVKLKANKDKIKGTLPHFLITQGQGKLIMVDIFTKVWKKTQNNFEKEHSHLRIKLIHIWHRHNNIKKIKETNEYIYGFKWIETWAKHYTENHSNDLSPEILKVYERVLKSREDSNPQSND